MLTDVEGSPGSLPLLQYTLTELWKHDTDSCLDLRTYSQLGGVMGTLQKRATAVFEQFPDEQKPVVKHLFLALTQLGEGTEDTRRRVLKPDLVNKQYSESLIDQVVQRLANENLIVTNEIVEKGATPNRVAVVDIAHEALIRHWALLRKWIEENRDKLRQKRKIEAAAEEWRSKGKPRYYLLQGRQLLDAKTFQQGNSGVLPLSALAEEFIQKGLSQKWRSILLFGAIPALGVLTLTTMAGAYVVQQAQIAEENRQEQVMAKYVDQMTELLLDKKYGEPTEDRRISAVASASTLSTVGQLDGGRKSRLIKFLYDAKLLGECSLGKNLEIVGCSPPVLDISGANFSGLSLNVISLPGINLSGVNLSGSSLSELTLRGRLRRSEWGGKAPIL